MVLSVPWTSAARCTYLCSRSQGVDLFFIYSRVVYCPRFVYPLVPFRSKAFTHFPLLVHESLPRAGPSAAESPNRLRISTKMSTAVVLLRAPIFCCACRSRVKCFGYCCVPERLGVRRVSRMKHEHLTTVITKKHCCHCSKTTIQRLSLLKNNQTFPRYSNSIVVACGIHVTHALRKHKHARTVYITLLHVAPFLLSQSIFCLGAGKGSRYSGSLQQHCSLWGATVRMI